MASAGERRILRGGIEDYMGNRKSIHVHLSFRNASEVAHTLRQIRQTAAVGVTSIAAFRVGRVGRRFGGL
jgi:hypothetical protein